MRWRDSNGVTNRSPCQHRYFYQAALQVRAGFLDDTHSAGYHQSANMNQVDPLVGQSLLHYEIVHKLGSGGMGVVYEAQDSHLGRRVALKFLPLDMAQDSQLLERFQREARAASSLNHPNICTIHSIEQHERRHFIVMELLEGETIAQKMNRQPMEMDKLLALGIQNRRRARIGPRQGDRAPRHKAGESVPDRARTGEDSGLRASEDDLTDLLYQAEC